MCIFGRIWTNFCESTGEEACLCLAEGEGLLPRGRDSSAAFEKMNENEAWVLEAEILVKAKDKAIECENTKSIRWVKVKGENLGPVDLDLSGKCF